MRSEIPLWTLRGIGLALGVVLVYALLQLGIAAARVFLLVFIAVLLASALEPMLGWLRHRVSVLSRAGTILVVYLTFIVTVVGLAFVVVPAAVGQAQRILADLPPFFAEVRAWADTVRPASIATSLTTLIDSVAVPNDSFLISLKPSSPRQRLMLAKGSAINEPSLAGNVINVTLAACDPSVTANSAFRNPRVGTDFHDGGTVNFGTSSDCGPLTFAESAADGGGESMGG